MSLVTCLIITDKAVVMVIAEYCSALQCFNISPCNQVKVSLSNQFSSLVSILTTCCNSNLIIIESSLYTMMMIVMMMMMRMYDDNDDGYDNDDDDTAVPIAEY